jgi:UPF0176 protein
MSKVLHHNKLNQVEAAKKIAGEGFDRSVLSFYKYVRIKNPERLRGVLFKGWEGLNVLGRVYLAKEGVNAQVSVPDFNLDAFKALVNDVTCFKGLDFKESIEKNNYSFFKLTVKVKDQIVADGLSLGDYDITNPGKHVDAKEWNELIEQGAIVVDMRNHYESEVGHFNGAILPEAVTFKEELPLVKNLLSGKENEKVLLYCTGGIRCEKASAYLKNKGFKCVHQLSGGIIGYAKQVKENGLENKFKGKNFVFDNRLGERISEDVISYCHQCNQKSDNHTNCANLNCNLLFIQCVDCRKRNKNCCSPTCLETTLLSEEEQKKIRVKRRTKPIFNNHRKVDLTLNFKK